MITEQLLAYVVEHPEAEARIHELGQRFDGRVEFCIVTPDLTDSGDSVILVNDVIARTFDRDYYFVIKPDGKLIDLQDEA